MRFAEPHWLFVGAVAVCALLALRVRAERLVTRAIAQLTGAHVLGARVLPSRFTRWSRVALSCLAVAAAFVALARPQRGLRWETLDRRGTDLLLAIDTSKSMNADDVSPTRLERTKLAVRDLIEHFPSDRVGLLAFAGDAVLESPLTLDHGAVLETLAAFDASLVERPGTDVERAIDVASEALKSESAGHKVVVLISDGEELEGKGLAAAERAARAGVTIETLGVGTPAGELVPAKDERGTAVGVLRDAAGNPVRSRLNEAGLRAIAQAAHGSYRELGADGGGLERLYAETLAPLARTEHGARVRRVYAEWFAVPLGVSLAALLLDALLGWAPRRPRRRGRSDGGSEPRKSTGSRAAAVAALAVMTAVAGRANASPQSAEQAYREGHFEESARQYEAERARHPDDARLAVDAAAAAYRAGKFDAAEAELGKALAVADPKLRERAFYDLGDARYRLGVATLESAPDKTIERWKAALSAYESALKLTPADADARYNRDFVKRKLSELEQRQPPPPQKQQPDQKSDSNSSQGSKGQASKSNPGKNGNAASAGAQNQAGKDGNTKSKPGEAAGAKQAGNSGQSQDANHAQGTQSKTGAQENAASGRSEPQPAANGQPAKLDAAGNEQQGRLSAAAARALLGSLRGEERRAASPGNGTAQRGETSPQKDW